VGDITRAELASLGLRAQALTSISDADQDAAINAASSKARSYLRARYPNAGTITDVGYKEAVAKIATHMALSTRGFDPQRGGDEVVIENAAAAVRWLRDVSNGVAHLDVPEPESDTFAAALGPGDVLSDEPRGW